MLTSAVGGSPAPSCVLTQLEATDVPAGMASGWLEMDVPVTSFHLLLLLRFPTRLQGATLMRVNEHWMHAWAEVACVNVLQQHRRRKHDQLRGPLLLLVRAMPLSTRTVSNNALRLVPTPDWCYVRLAPCGETRIIWTLIMTVSPVAEANICL